MTTTAESPLAPIEIKEWHWTRVEKCAGLSRQVFRKQLIKWEVSHLEEDAVLCFSELWTNAFRYCPTGVSVTTRWILHPCYLRVEADDCSGEWPLMDTTGQVRDSGRGLILVNILANRWGTNTLTTPHALLSPMPSKTVWFEIDR